MEYIDGNIKVAWVALGEGRDGDYNPDDPDDVELLRFDTYYMKDGEWEAFDDGSYCTATPVNTPTAALAAGLVEIAFEVKAAYEAGHSVKKTCEQLSWVSWMP